MAACEGCCVAARVTLRLALDGQAGLFGCAGPTLYADSSLIPSLAMCLWCARLLCSWTGE